MGPVEQFEALKTINCVGYQYVSLREALGQKIGTNGIGSLGETAAVSGFSRIFLLLLKSTKPECRIILKHLACQCELSFLRVRTLGQWERGNLRIALLYSTLSPPLCDNVTTLDNVSGSRTMKSWKFLDLSQSPSLHLCKLEERDISLLLCLNENLE